MYFDGEAHDLFLEIEYMSESGDDLNSLLCKHNDRGTVYGFHGSYEGGIAVTRLDHLIGLFSMEKDSVRLKESFIDHESCEKFIKNSQLGFYSLHEVTVYSGFVTPNAKLMRYVKRNDNEGAAQLLINLHDELAHLGDKINPVISNELTMHGILLAEGRTMAKNIPHVRA